MVSVCTRELKTRKVTPCQSAGARSGFRAGTANWPLTTLAAIQGVCCQPEPSSMPYTGQVMMIFGGGLAAAASANSAEP
jgi:hypothetical protein